ARFGHDHVVASRHVQGWITLGTNAGVGQLPPPAAGRPRADLSVALDRLTVDEPALRAAAGFDTQPSAQDIAGTRTNMLDKVLQAERHPRLLVQVRQSARAIFGAGDASDMEAVITLHGVTRTLPVRVALEGDRNALAARGSFTVLQSDFGIQPFAILGGAIQVQDRLAVRFELQARRFTP
ncbi:MAG: YceI family protein, partial [Betaproteobacteria bacterium]|nr:YceI family protein [Betaproteobacteria bacterium]